jgi:benzoate-CoA ligase
MPEFSTVDRSCVPPCVSVPRNYNATVDLLDVNLVARRADKVAIIDDNGTTTYGQLAQRVNRCGNALKRLGLGLEQRVVMLQLDSIDFPTVFLGAMRIGAVPVPLNTLLTPSDYAYMIRDSRARFVTVSASLYERVKEAFRDQQYLERIIVVGDPGGDLPTLDQLLVEASPVLAPAPTTSDDAAFWLYSSGSTGAPKGVVHLHSHLVHTAELYARPIMGIAADDIVYSAAKLFFAYGLGNALTFPFRVGATAIYMAERPTPAAVVRILRQHSPTIFCAVPTLFSTLLASPELPAKEELALRRCVSAGEALPEDVGKRWTARTGVDILDGIGSTEMLHIFLSNRADALRYGTTGLPVPGYELRLIDEQGREVAGDGIGELQVKGPSCTPGYWNKRARSRETFLGPWTRGGDKYRRDADGYYVYCGRTDDMLKVGGIWVSPFEVEAALITHPAVLEAAVIGLADENGLTKPKAYVVLKGDQRGSLALEESLKEHVKMQLAPFKYPRWIEFCAELPKTATGKIQRFKLRQQAGARVAPVAKAG